MLAFTIDAGRCTRCGDCVRDCPSGIIHLPAGGLPEIAAEDEENCLRCQHCLAVCPEAAVSILGRHPADSLSLQPGELPTLAQLSLLVRGRRSCRQYRDEDVDRVLLDQLLATVAHAPTGVNRQELTFRVVAERAALRALRERVYREALDAVEAGRLPADSGVVHFARTFFDTGRDIVFRDAPHVLLVSAPPEAGCRFEDTALALAYFELLAHTAGLGTVWCGLLRMSLEALPRCKPLFGLPTDHHYYPMLFGLPAVRYARTVQRPDGAAVERIGLP